MADDPGPRNDVLAERIDNLSTRIGSMESRMGDLATEKTLIALIEGRDRVYGAQLKALQDDIAGLTASLAAEREERKAGDKEIDDRANRAKTFALSAIGLGVTIVLALVGLITQLGGPPA